MRHGQLYFTFDYDNVLVNSDGLLDRLIAKEFPTVKQLGNSYSWREKYKWKTDKQFRTALRRFNALDAEVEIPTYWVKLIKNLVEKGVKVDVVTARTNESFLIAEQSVRKAFGDSVDAFSSSRKALYAIYNNVDMHLDDAPSMLDDFMQNSVNDKLCVFGQFADYGLAERAYKYVVSCEEYLAFLNSEFSLGLTPTQID